MSKRHAIIEILSLKFDDHQAELDNDKDHPKSGRFCKARTSKIIKKARERVKRNPKRLFRKMAQERNGSRSAPCFS